ncbi:MAG: condensation domain-containing protein, partial [Pseudomonadota bacterium]
MIRTQHLCRGYVDSDSVGRFTRNPFSEDSEDRVYRSGDVGYYLSDGNVRLVGRADRQLKIRGFRVEADHVSHCLQEAANISQVAVVARPGADGQSILAAYCVSDDALDFDDIRLMLQRDLPEYAVPGQLGQIESLPLTPNGKLDESALPELQALESRAVEAPATPLESFVADVFSSLLKVEQVSRHDSFFALGGHSLLGAQLVARINQYQQCDLPLKALFEGPSPAQLARSIEALGSSGESSALPPLEPVEHLESCDISFAQERLWYLQQMLPGSGAFNLSGALRLGGQLDSAALASAFRVLVERQDALRTKIVNINGWPSQQLLDTEQVPLRIHDYRGSDEDLAEILRESSAKGFDFESDALMRADLYRLSDEEHVLQLVCHHIIADAWSMGVLVRELTESYNAIVESRDAVLPTLAVSYRDYTIWQRRYLKDDARESALSFWRDTLRGANMTLDLPADRPRPREFSHAGARHRFVIPATDIAPFKQLLQKSDATLFMGLMAVYQLMLSRYCGQDDLLVGTPVANRAHPELENLFGFFVNTLILRGTPAKASDFEQFLAQIRSRSIDAYAHQSLPFEVLVEDLQPKRDLSRNPVFQVMFVLQNMAMPSMDLKGLSVAPIDAERTTAQVDLTLFAWEQDGALTGVFEYATDLFDHATIVRMESHFR